MPMSGDYARTGGAFGRDLGLSRFTRPCTSLPGMRVARVLDQLGAERGLPELIVVDNGPSSRGDVNGGEIMYRQGGSRAEMWLSLFSEKRGGLVCLNSAARFDKWNRAAVR